MIFYYKEIFPLIFSLITQSIATTVIIKVQNVTSNMTKGTNESLLLLAPVSLCMSLDTALVK